MSAASQRVRPLPVEHTGQGLDRAQAARQRQQRYRQRRNAGLVTLSVTVDEIALAEKLTEAGYLRCHDDDRTALAAALERMLADLAVVHVTHGR